MIVLQFTQEEFTELVRNAVKQELAVANPQTKVVTEDIMNVKQAALFLKLSVATIYSKTCRRELPFSKRGKTLYFSRKKLEKYIDDGNKKTIAEINQSL